MKFIYIFHISYWKKSQAPMCKTTPVFNIQEIAAPSYIYISLHEIVVSKFFFFLHAAFNGSDENPFVNEKFKNKHICFVLNSVFGWPGTHVKQSDGFDKCRFKKNSVPAHCMVYCLKT